MTVLNIAYLALAIGAWLAFAVVVMWATHITNPAQKRVEAKRQERMGAVRTGLNPLAG